MDTDGHRLTKRQAVGTAHTSCVAPSRPSFSPMSFICVHLCQSVASIRLWNLLNRSSLRKKTPPPPPPPPPPAPPPPRKKKHTSLTFHAPPPIYPTCKKLRIIRKTPVSHCGWNRMDGSGLQSNDRQHLILRFFRLSVIPFLFPGARISPRPPRLCAKISFLTQKNKSEKISKFNVSAEIFRKMGGGFSENRETLFWTCLTLTSGRQKDGTGRNRLSLFACQYRRAGLPFPCFCLILPVWRDIASSSANDSRDGQICTSARARFFLNTKPL